MNIIDSVIDTEKTRRNVRIMLPIMIHWAKTGQTHHVYDDLIKALGYKQYSGIGYPLGKIQDVIDHLEKSYGTQIPTLNSLVKYSPNGLPSHGFDYVNKRYKNLTEATKRDLVLSLDKKACLFQDWDWVLEKLDLDSYEPFSNDEINEIKNSKKNSGGGEGAEHNKIKKYIKNNPWIIGIKNVVKGENEYPLPSGDMLDVYFELKDGRRIGIEVKPSNAEDSDITRGIFQCVKYKAVMDALSCVDNHELKNSVIFIRARHLSDIHYRLISNIPTEHIYFDKSIIDSQQDDN